MTTEIDSLTPARRHLVERLKSRRKELRWAGIGMAIVGVLALAFPVISSVSVELMFGWLMTVAGVIILFTAFQIEGTGPFFGQFLQGLLSLALGLYLLTHPGVGLISLTLLIAIIFMVDGAWQIGLSFEVKHLEASWFWILISGVISIVAGLLIVTSLPGASLVMLGLLTGLNFLSTGIALMFLAHHIGDVVERVEHRNTTSGTGGPASP